MKKNIAIIAGGDSSEVVVSLKSAQGVKSFINSASYQTYIVTMQENVWTVECDGKDYPIDKNDFSFTPQDEKITFDCAYITIHGTPGEDGILQGYFDLINMPYTSCNVLVSALTFNKFVCNTYLRGFGLNVAESLVVRKGMNIDDEAIVNQIGLPCFIKPNAGGSSFGVSKVTTQEQVVEAINKAFSESDEVIIEAFISGTEVTNGIYKTKEKTMVLPITEVVTENDFFDFEAKYIKGKADEITPARLSDDLTTRIKSLTSAIYDILGCMGLVRIDYIIQEGDVFLLEINTVPGMTATSFIPQQIEAQGLDISDVFEDLIEDAIARHKQI